MIQSGSGIHLRVQLGYGVRLLAEVGKNLLITVRFCNKKTEAGDGSGFLCI